MLSASLPSAHEPWTKRRQRDLIQQAGRGLTDLVSRYSGMRPVLIIISGPLEDCCRAAQNLMLSAHALGLGTCWVGSPLLWPQTEEVKAELQVPAALTPNVAMCA